MKIGKRGKIRPASECAAFVLIVERRLRVFRNFRTHGNNSHFLIADEVTCRGNRYIQLCSSLGQTSSINPNSIGVK